MLCGKIDKNKSQPLPLIFPLWLDADLSKKDIQPSSCHTYSLFRDTNNFCHTILIKLKQLFEENKIQKQPFQYYLVKQIKGFKIIYYSIVVRGVSQSVWPELEKCSQFGKTLKFFDNFSRV